MEDELNIFGVHAVIAGVFDFKKNNVFGGTAFIAYGFWCAMSAFRKRVTSGTFGEQAAAAFDPKQTGGVSRT